MRQIREDTRSRFPNWNDGIMTEPSLIQMIRIDAVNSRYVRCHIVDRLADEIESQPLFRLTFVEVNLFNKFEHYWKVRSFTFKVWYRLLWYMLVYLLVLSTNRFRIEFGCFWTVFTHFVFRKENACTNTSKK